MSDRLCNFCQWKAMKRERKGYRIAKAAERRELWDNGGPYSGQGTVIVDRAGAFVCWFMRLPEHCEC